jgi:(2Fe-2S) ferredoxin
MEVSPPHFEKYIFVCENQKETGDCCAALGVTIREELKKKVKEAGLAKRIRVSRTGCLDVCSEGPNVLLMPDDVWYKHVQLSDVPKILEDAFQRLKK